MQSRINRQRWRAVFYGDQERASAPVIIETALKLQVLLFEDEDGFVVAECPELPGCVSEGRTRDEALFNIREAIAACIEARRELGLPVAEDLSDETKKLRVKLSVPALSGAMVRQTFERLGWQYRYSRKAEMILTKQGSSAVLSIPDR